MKYHVHIDTLYLQLKIPASISDALRGEILATIVEDDNAVMLGSVPSYFVYSLPDYRVLFGHDRDAIQRGKLYDIIIQYEHNQLFHSNPLDLLDTLPLPRFIPEFRPKLEDWIIKRIDYNATMQKPELTGNVIFRSKYFRGRFPHDRVKGTVYLGSRSAGKMFRIYDKHKEVIDNKSAIKFDQMLQFFDGDISGLTTVEVELLRGYIRDNISKRGSLADWEKIVNTAAMFLESLDWAFANDRNVSNYNNNNYSRVPFSKVVDGFDHTENLIKQMEYRPNIMNLARRIKMLKDDFSKRLQKDITMEELIIAMNDDEFDISDLL